MKKDWATFGLDLHLELGRDQPGHGVRAGLESALREAVRTGRLGPGVRLPSSRALAADLGVARNTVAEAYGQLVAEGWLTAVQGSGTRVAARPPPACPPRLTRPRRRAGPRGRAPARPARPRPPRRQAPVIGSPGAASSVPPGPRVTPYRYSLRVGSPDLSAFPRAAWLAAARRALSAAPSEAFGYGHPQGRPELRAALAEYLARARGVRAHPDRIVVCDGFGEGLALLTRVLRARGATTLAVEEYGLPSARDTAAAAGLPAGPAAGGRSRRRGRSASPSRSGRRRAAHPGAPVPARGRAGPGPAHAVCGVGPGHRRPGHRGRLRRGVPLRPATGGRAAGAGTRARGLRRFGQQEPRTRIPAGLAGAARAAGRRGDRGPGADHRARQPLDQLTLAEFITSGGYDRHVRRSRLAYRRRRDRLAAALGRERPAGPGDRHRGRAARPAASCRPA